jgi:hypothetical protein
MLFALLLLPNTLTHFVSSRDLTSGGAGTGCVTGGGVTSVGVTGGGAGQ